VPPKFVAAPKKHWKPFPFPVADRRFGSRRASAALGAQPNFNLILSVSLRRSTRFRRRRRNAAEERWTRLPQRQGGDEIEM